MKMTSEEKGHFECGAWVSDPDPAATALASAGFGRRYSDATASVVTSVHDMISVTHDLVTTEEGKQYIGRTVAGTGSQVRRSLDEIISWLRAEVEKKQGSAA